MEVTLDGRLEHVQCEGTSTTWGDKELLIKNDENLIRDCAWASLGYCIQPFLETADFDQITDGVRRILHDYVQRFTGALCDFPLTNYHTQVAEEVHMEILDALKFGLPMEEFLVPKPTLEDRISKIIGTRVTTAHPSGLFDRFHIRIVRPLVSDYNPLHKDAWLNRLRHGINLYIPIAGSNENSSPPVVPGSHLWHESEVCRTLDGAKMNGLSYTVPSVVGAHRPLQLKRPNPGPNEVLLFSPYLLHGLAINRNPNTTRVSLEIRLWKKA